MYLYSFKEKLTGRTSRPVTNIVVCGLGSEDTATHAFFRQSKSGKELEISIENIWIICMVLYV